MIYNSNMFDLFNRKKILDLHSELETVKQENAKKLQNLQISFYTARRDFESQQEKYAWNRYTSYDLAVQEIHRMYNCRSPWGITIGPLIDLRAAFVGGHGIEINQVIPDSDREKAFVEKFLQINGLNSAGFLNFLREPEKEGKCLVKLIDIPDFSWSWTDKGKKIVEKGMPAIEHLSWIKYRYKIEGKKDNKEIAEKAIYQNVNNEDIILNEPEFVYRRWRGPSNEINEAISVFQRVIEHVIALEKTYFDYRLSNHLFAAPKPYIKCADSFQAQEMKAIIDQYGDGFNIASRQIMITVGDFGYAVPPASPVLDNEIRNHRKAIAFITGIPEQFLGDSSDVRGKDLSSNLMQGVDHAMEGDRQTAQDFLNELVQKAIKMVNGKTTPLKEDAIEIAIGKITAADWNRIPLVYFPAATNGLISKETYLQKIPGIDPEEELERLEKENKKKKQEQANNDDSFFDKILSNERADRIEGNNQKEVIDADTRKEVERQRF